MDQSGAHTSSRSYDTVNTQLPVVVTSDVAKQNDPGLTVGTTPAFRHSRNWRYLVTTQVASFDDISSQETWHAAFPSLGNFTGLASLTQQEESDYLPSLTTHHQRACSTTFQGAFCLSHKLYISQKYMATGTSIAWLRKSGFTLWWKVIMPKR